jgi:uncharacterized membrane protein
MSIIRLRDFGDRVRATYWYLPTLMTALAAVCAVLLYWADQAIPSYLLQDKWYIFHPESLIEARSLLTNIANVSLGVVGVVFSVTLVPMSIAASQYGSIVLRSFLRDRGTQCVLGAYTSTTFYCLTLLMALRSATNQSGAQFSLTIAVYMLLVSLLLLLYFFHHVADSLQASSVINQISEELERTIEQENPVSSAHTLDPRQGEVDELRRTVLREGEGVPSNGEGYVRAIDFNYLVDVATKSQVILYLKCLAGDFVSRGDQLLFVWPALSDKHLISSTNRAYMLGRNRTLFQDPEYGITLVTMIAVRALSSAINDPYTPMLCLDRLGAALGMIAERATPRTYYLDTENHLRVITKPTSFERLVDTAFNMIREYGRANAEVLMKMLETAKTVAAHTHSDAQQKVLLKHITLIEGDSRIGLGSEYDKQRVHDTYEETLRAVRPNPEP